MARIYKTTNGGNNWLSNKDKEYHKYLSVNYSKRTLVNIAGSTIYSYPDTGKLTQSVNGGITWTERTLGDSIIQLRKIKFVDSLYGWISGWKGTNAKAN